MIIYIAANRKSRTLTENSLLSRSKVCIAVDILSITVVSLFQHYLTTYSYIFCKVASLYEFVGPHSYDLIRFL